MAAAAAATTERKIGGTASGGAAEIPWWTGVPTELVRRRTLVEGTPTAEALERGSTLSLPVRTLTFAIPDVRDPEDGDAGGGGDCRPVLTGRARRHDRVKMELGDIVKMVIPGYKPKSYSMSGLRKDRNEFDVTVKVYPNGRASGFLDKLAVGDTIHSFGICKNKIRNVPPPPAAARTVADANADANAAGGNNNANAGAANPDDDNSGSGSGGGGDFVVGLIAYGVGITEAWPIARAELDRVASDGAAADTAVADKVVLVWASRTPADTFWNDELRSYQARHPGRFELVRFYSRSPDAGGRCRHGRIDAGVLAELFGRGRGGGAPSETRTRFLSVGTKAMMRKTDEMLRSIGYSMPEHALLIENRDPAVAVS